jgi:hypothetical protein
MGVSRAFPRAREIKYRSLDVEAGFLELAKISRG